MRQGESSGERGTFGPDQIRSAGPDTELDTADDLVFPPRPMDIYGTVIVVIKGHDGDQVITDPESCLAALHFSAEGKADTVRDETAPFPFSGVHRGLHPIEVACEREDGGEAHETDVIAVRCGGAQQLTEIHVELGSGSSSEREESESDSDGPDAATREVR